jgi:hypothetical protein
MPKRWTCNVAERTEIFFNMAVGIDDAHGRPPVLLVCTILNTGCQGVGVTGRSPYTRVRRQRGTRIFLTALRQAFNFILCGIL